MFKQKHYFNGSLVGESLRDVVAHKLLALVNMILFGPNIENQSYSKNTSSVSASQSISQLIMFNSVIHPITEITTEAKELKWLQKVMEMTHKEQLDSTDWIYWSAYHASIAEVGTPTPADCS